MKKFTVQTFGDKEFVLLSDVEKLLTAAKIEGFSESRRKSGSGGCTPKTLVFKDAKDYETTLKKKPLFKKEQTYYLTG
jgi:hypothetical protein